MMLPLLHLPSAYHNSSCDGCVRGAEENRIAKEEFGRQSVAKERLSHLYPVA